MNIVKNYPKLYQLEANGNLIEQWNSRYCDQGKRVKAVMDIARLERKSLYEDIESLISDNSRFVLENLLLLQHTPQIWLSRRNQVIVKFIETLTHNNLNTDLQIMRNFTKGHGCRLNV